MVGSPLDAHSRYLRAAELCRVAADHVWVGACLEGQAASLVAMADMGGMGVDEFLNATFGGDLNPYARQDLTDAEKVRWAAKRKSLESAI